MKLKFIIALMAAALVSVSAFGKSTITKGDKNILMDNSIVCSFVYDFTNTSIEDTPYQDYLTKQGDKFTKEWFNEVLPLGTKRYVETWNRKNKNGLQVTKDSTAAYKMVIAPSYLNLGSGAASFFIGLGAGGDKLNGTITVYKDDEALLEITVEGQTGNSDNAARNRFGDLMNQLAKDTLNDVLK
jgi:hypothetical protein